MSPISALAYTVVYPIGLSRVLDLDLFPGGLAEFSSSLTFITIF